MDSESEEVQEKNRKYTRLEGTIISINPGDRPPLSCINDISLSVKADGVIRLLSLDNKEEDDI